MTQDGNPLQSRARRVPLWLRVPLIALPLWVCSWWAWHGTGLYGSVTAWQLSLLNGEYFPVLSFIAPLLLLLAPSVAAVQLLAGFFPEKSARPAPK